MFIATGDNTTLWSRLIESCLRNECSLGEAQVSISDLPLGESRVHQIEMLINITIYGQALRRGGVFSTAPERFREI